MLSLAKPHNYYQNFLSQGIGMGLGMGMLFLPALSITSHYFRRRRSLAMGLVMAGAYMIVIPKHRALPYHSILFYRFCI